MKIEVPESGSPDAAWITSIIDITKETLQNRITWKKTSDNEFIAPVDQGELVLSVGLPTSASSGAIVGAAIGALLFPGILALSPLIGVGARAVGSIIGAGVAAAAQEATRLVLRQHDGSVVTFRSGPAISALVQAVRLSPAASEDSAALDSAHA
jgi:hypothetical protein